MSLWNIDWKEVTIWWLVCILVFGVGYAAGAYDSKHAADLWWQANWDNYARSGSHWSDDTDKFACPGKGPTNAQELAWWRAHATPEHPCPKEKPTAPLGCAERKTWLNF